MAAKRPYRMEEADLEPIHGEIEVRVASANPFAWVAAVREGLRRARVGRREIDRFTREALADDAVDPRRACRRWVRVRTTPGSR